MSGKSEEPSELEQAVRFGFIDRSSPHASALIPKLLINGPTQTIEHAIVQELRRSDFFLFSVAFVTSGALAQLKQHFLDYQGRGAIVTSDFLEFNQPQMFRELLKLSRLRDISVRRFKGKGYHPKGYLFRNTDFHTALVGSANLTSQALVRNHEWNLRVSASRDSDLAAQFDSAIQDQLEQSEPLTEEWIERYSLAHKEPSRVNTSEPTDRPEQHSFPDLVKPNSMQIEALEALSQARERGNTRAIIISATGTGKTMLSAFDVRNVNPQRFLFVVHREQILDRTIDEYKRVLKLPSTEFGKVSGSRRELDRRFVFATVQTVHKPEILETLRPDLFDYVIIDEAHRSGSPTYQALLAHLRPRFLLGMTATPERTDGFNVFETFDFNVPYEIRLNRALEEDMLAPFHYYGVSDVTFEDGSTTSDLTDLPRLVSAERISHLVKALETYGQEDVPPCGLIFCSRIAEAEELSEALNESEIGGRRLRTRVVSGNDSVELREQYVEALESGELDYLLTVDVFNEGVDIPSLNQVVMLRQTQSAIVFVQQLGRGLRKSAGKDFLVVIDFIGNYANNFLIPIALFGDERLNKEALRERLNETVEAGSIPGLSSVSFDEVSRQRVLESISRTQLDSMSRIKSAFFAMRNRVGGTPSLFDFYRFNSIDPITLATKKNNYPSLVETISGEDSNLSPRESQYLSLLSSEVLAGKRLHEFFLLRSLLETGEVSLRNLGELFEGEGLFEGYGLPKSAVSTLALEGYPQVAVARYGAPVATVDGSRVMLSQDFLKSYERNQFFRFAVQDLMKTGIELTNSRYARSRPFVPGAQYSRGDAAHLLGWPRAVASTIYGVKADTELGVCAIFVTLEKSQEISASTAYRDQLVDPQTMRWFTKSNRTLSSKDVVPIVGNEVEIHVFVKKDDAEGGDHYYLGAAKAREATETTMPGNDGNELPVVSMLLDLEAPISQGLFDYFDGAA